MNRRWMAWIGVVFGMWLVGCSSSSNAQRPDENPAMEGQQQRGEAGMDGQGCNCAMNDEGVCPHCDQAGRHGGSCPMGKGCPAHNIPEGSRAIVEDTPDGAIIRLEAPDSDPASVEALQKAARKMGRMVEEGCPMGKGKMNQQSDGMSPPPPARE